MKKSYDFLTVTVERKKNNKVNIWIGLQDGDCLVEVRCFT